MVLGELQQGYLLAGRYRLEEPLGSGGHAYVYSARQEGLDRKVAVKLLKSAPGLNEDALPPHKVEVLVKRFEQEAKLISQLRDPGTITMYDYGATDDGLLYMVVEFIEGGSLKEHMDTHGALSPPRVVKILEQLLCSLQEAHALGVMHRDIKPDNIMLFTHLGRRDQVKLLDFGIAKIVKDTSLLSPSDWTREGMVVGTPRYIAPELVRGEELTSAADLYSLGLVAYEMLTGERVMAGLKGIKALHAQIYDPSVTLPDTVTIPENLRCIVDRMMEKELALRYTSAEEILLDLEHWDSEDFLPSESEGELETLPVSISSLAHKLRDDAHLKDKQIAAIKRRVEAAKAAKASKKRDFTLPSTPIVEIGPHTPLDEAPTIRTLAIPPSEPPSQPEPSSTTRAPERVNSKSPSPAQLPSKPPPRRRTQTTSADHTAAELPIAQATSAGKAPNKFPPWLVRLLIGAVVFDGLIAIYLLVGR
ncbi:MAG: serine/threonine-protein kinase [Myxococcota bacterium]|nr:serine/threonine-protein kinase [Myxococcota bacterium]